VGNPRRLLWADNADARSSGRGSPGMKPRSCASQPAQEGLPNRRAGSVSCPAHPHHGAPGPAGSVAMKPGLDSDHEARALNTCRSQGLLAGKREIFPVRGQGLPPWAGPGNATRVSPARAGRCPVDRWVRDRQKASARPGGGKAPAEGGAGAGRGLWAPAGVGSVWRCGRGDGPCH